MYRSGMEGSFNNMKDVCLFTPSQHLVTMKTMGLCVDMGTHVHPTSTLHV